MTTARTICTRALVLSGIAAVSDSISSDDINYAFDTVNEMLDSWNSDASYIYVSDELIGVVQGNAFSVGPGGDIYAPARPTTMEPGAYSVLNGISYPIRWITEKEYNGISYKDSPAPYPSVAYYSADSQVGQVFVWPLISDPLEVHLVTQQMLREFATLDTKYIFPPGYRMAIVYSLAELLCAGVRQVDPIIARNAMKARASIRQLNGSVPMLDLPSSVQQCRPGNYYIC